MDPPEGRSRGRARGRAQPQVPTTGDIVGTMQSIRISNNGSNGNGSNGNGSNGGPSGNGNGNGNGNGSNGNGAALRGRGAYRSRNDELVTRPTNLTEFKGTQGEEIELFCNYFRLQTPNNAVVQAFHVDFIPTVETPQMRRRMLYGIENLFANAFIFDGMSNIKTLDTDGRDRTHVVTNTADPNPATNQIQIKIRRTGEVPWGSSEMMRLFNTQMRQNLRHIGYILMGRNYFDNNSEQRIPQSNVKLWPGVITAIAQHEAGILMVVDSSTKFVRDETVLDLMSAIRSRGGNLKEEAQKEICTMIVMTKYNNRTYKVDDIDFDQNPSTAVFTKNDKQINLVDYYKQAYNITITQVRQPLLKCLPNARDRRAGRVEPILLVPELCLMTGLTEKMRSDFQLMKKIGDVSRLKPNDRCKNLVQFINKIRTNDKVKTDMDKWKLGFDNQLLKVKGRRLQCEKIYMGNDDEHSSTSFQQRTGDFSKEIRSKPLFRAGPSIAKWMIIYTGRDEGLVDDFAQTLNRVCGPMGIRLGQPRKKRLENDRTSSFVQECQALATPCEMVVLIVPNNNKDRYDAIKKICYCENPMPSQVIVSRTLSKKQMLMSVCTKIGIQMACKMGGEPWALKIPPKDIMVVGYDTYHDSLQKGKSVGGFVCSLNQTLTSWYSRVSFHEDQNEMSANFALNLKDGINKYFEINKSLPIKVIVYRDGVGEGQIPHVFDFEVKQIQTALSKVTEDQVIPFAFVIVTKRVNARFFAGTAGNVDNPIPGTLVDCGVTRDIRYDFYLISQSVRQGTVTPTMYNIIHDTTSFKPTHHQQLAYKLTHLYFNWPGTIRVPAPCQYAHKLAFLTGTSLHREPSLAMTERLYYL